MELRLLTRVPENGGGCRINKYLSEAGICSRREADRLIAEGRVSINGRQAVPGDRVLPDDEIVCDGKKVSGKASGILLLFYKPRGIVCSTRRQRDEQTVTDYLAWPERIYPAGRLDKDSEGLLLMTNQGELVNRMMKASEYHEKEYIVTVDRPVTDDFVRAMSSGIPVLGQMTRRCLVEKLGKNTFRIILTQGLNRQIRRMCEYLGYRVRRLVRVRIMNLTLDGLKPGEYRKMTENEKNELLAMLSSKEKNAQPAVTGGKNGR
ncbi:MAG: pseudouridine synthase [Blautia sp.]|nr:pseudouridine synthase [Blautia sp.]